MSITLSRRCASQRSEHNNPSAGSNLFPFPRIAIPNRGIAISFRGTSVQKDNMLSQPQLRPRPAASSSTGPSSKPIRFVKSYVIACFLFRLRRKLGLLVQFLCVSASARCACAHSCPIAIRPAIGFVKNYVSACFLFQLRQKLGLLVQFLRVSVAALCACAHRSPLLYFAATYVSKDQEAS